MADIVRGLDLLAGEAAKSITNKIVFLQKEAERRQALQERQAEIGVNFALNMAQLRNNAEQARLDRELRAQKNARDVTNAATIERLKDTIQALRNKAQEQFDKATRQQDVALFRAMVSELNNLRNIFSKDAQNMSLPKRIALAETIKRKSDDLAKFQKTRLGFAPTSGTSFAENTSKFLSLINQAELPLTNEQGKPDSRNQTLRNQARLTLFRDVNLSKVSSEIKGLLPSGVNPIDVINEAKQKLIDLAQAGSINFDRFNTESLTQIAKTLAVEKTNQLKLQQEKNKNKREPKGPTIFGVNPGELFVKLSQKAGLISSDEVLAQRRQERQAEKAAQQKEKQAEAERRLAAKKNRTIKLTAEAKKFESEIEKNAALRTRVLGLAEIRLNRINGSLPTISKEEEIPTIKKAIAQTIADGRPVTAEEVAFTLQKMFEGRVKLTSPNLFNPVSPP